MGLAVLDWSGVQPLELFCGASFDVPVSIIGGGDLCLSLDPPIGDPVSNRLS